MTDKEKDFFPLVSPELLSLLAPIIWTLAGLKLTVRGYFALDWWAHPNLFACALLVGVIKSLLILDRLVRKNVKRLKSYSEPVFIGRVFPGRTWFIVGSMIILGRLLRYSSLSLEIKGVITLAVGIALIMAGRLYWLGLVTRSSR